MSRRLPDLGVVLWRGHSALDGAPLVCILTLDTSNPKMNTAQTWIMRVDISPSIAVSTGQDFSTCGDCGRRRFLACAMPDSPREPCYVQASKAPRSVWSAYGRGRYAEIGTEAGARVLDIARTRGVRAGSYGDPALVPAAVWGSLRVVTGYTHQWRKPWAQAHKAWCMASCDGPADVLEAQAAGWRTFEAVSDGQVHTGSAVQCPNVTHGTQCQDCMLCGGRNKDARSVWLPVHGSLVSSESIPVLTGRRALQVWAA